MGPIPTAPLQLSRREWMFAKHLLFIFLGFYLFI